MSKRDDGPQFDFGQRLETGAIDAPKMNAAIVPFVDAATLQVRRDATRRFAANGIFAHRHDKD